MLSTFPPDIFKNRAEGVGDVDALHLYGDDVFFEIGNRDPVALDDNLRGDD